METPRIINTYDQLCAAGGGVAITPAHTSGREHGWYIYRVNAAGKQLVTDPKAAWYHHGSKWFHGEGATHGARQADALEQAKAWVAEKYGEQGPWKRNGMRAYVPERINKQFPLPKRKKDE